MRDDEDDELPGPDPDEIAADEGWELPPESRAVLLESLRSGDREVRLEAVETLVHAIDDGLATLALEMARGDADEEVRAVAAQVLAPGLAAAAAAAAGDGPPAPISATTAATLRQGLRHLYFDSATPKRVRRSALEGSSHAPEAWVEGAVRAASASPDAEWRTTAVACMARLSSFAAELNEALRDREPQVRLEAARAAGDGGFHDAAPRLLALARAADETALVRMAAMESLGLLGDRQALQPLRELAASADPELAFAARSALARISGSVEGPPEPDETYP